MSKQAMIDRLGRMLGTIETKPDGRRVALSADGMLIATFNPHTNETINPDGQMVAEGNHLMTLLESVA